VSRRSSIKQQGYKPFEKRKGPRVPEDFAMTITDDYKVFAGRYHPSSSAFSRLPEVRRSGVWCGKHIRFAEESSPSLIFCGLTQRDIDDPKNRAGNFLPHQFCCYPPDRNLPRKWDTYCPETFCGHCKKVKTNPITTRWECLGHPTQ